ETNLRRKGEKPENYNGLPLSQVGYISLFKLVESKGLSVGEAAIFAHLNKAAIVSLQAVGAEYEPIAGREDLKTPTILADGSKDFDFDYKPVAIPATPQNLKVFGELTPFAAPQMAI